MDLRLNGRRAVVTGSSGGIGEAIARRLAAEVAEILHNPTGRLGRPDEVANLVAFVASPLADYINGANLRIDGGSTAVV
jgi:NAD(P)-dependent dehydrogenase (short-subunit alcohol dehydrogenase family)